MRTLEELPKLPDHMGWYAMAYPEALLPEVAEHAKQVWFEKADHTGVPTAPDPKRPGQIIYACWQVPLPQVAVEMFRGTGVTQNPEIMVAGWHEQDRTGWEHLYLYGIRQLTVPQLWPARVKVFPRMPETPGVRVRQRPPTIYHVEEMVRPEFLASLDGGDNA